MSKQDLNKNSRNICVQNQNNWMFLTTFFLLSHRNTGFLLRMPPTSSPCTRPPSTGWRTWSGWATSMRPASSATCSSATTSASSTWVFKFSQHVELQVKLFTWPFNNPLYSEVGGTPELFVFKVMFDSLQTSADQKLMIETQIFNTLLIRFWHFNFMNTSKGVYKVTEISFKIKAPVTLEHHILF